MTRATVFFFGIMAGIFCATIIVEMRERKGVSSLNALRVALFGSSLAFLAFYVADS